ncbi:MAG TPA: outer membrane lipoprotein-sorting protein [Gammaproteobacteria bacterium]|nr:outer membrane lipoprotein-sorting protein [Gammaproteobacteria bacterium]
MRSFIAILVLVSCPLAFAQSESVSAGAGPLSAEAIIERSQRAFYYPADDMQAKVAMDLVDRDGGRRTRVMTFLRQDENEGGNQKYFIYFHEPGDIRGLVFMVWKYPGKEDDRWLFVPAVDLVRRIAADDKRSSFVGSDFTYEDVSGQDLSADDHTLLREEKAGEHDCYVVQSTPRTAAEYTRRISWIEKETFLPIREEYFDAQEQLFRVFTADQIEVITAGEDGNQTDWPTVTKRTMQNVKTGHRTEVIFSPIAYNLGLQDEDFSERRMRRPPREWLD